VEEVWIQAKVGNGGMVDGSDGEKANGKVIRTQISDQIIVAASPQLKRAKGIG
jgi:hypothetical protein